MKKKFFIFLICIILLITPTINVYADAPEISLLINPDSITLYPLEESDIVVTVQNDHSQEIYNLSLRLYGPVNLEPSEELLLPEKLSAGSCITLPIHLIRNEEGYPAGKLFIELTYDTLDEEGVSVLHRAVTKSLEILEHKPNPMEEMIKVEVTRKLTSLEESQEGVIQITATNLSPFNITIIDIIPDGTKYIEVSPKEVNSEVILLPYTSQVFTFIATLQSPYHIGEEPIYFTTLISWNQDGYSFSGNQVVSQPVSIEILSEQSEYLKLIGLPSFLFLPGFLFIITYLFCWKHFLPKSELGISTKDVEFWVLSITVSIPLIYLYRWVTDLLKSPWNFPNEFGLVDLQWLWILSLVVGILGWLLGFYIRKLINRKKPLPDDNPLTIIQKLYFNESGISLPQVKKDEINYIQFPIINIDNKKCWIIPFILYEFTKNITDEYKSEFFAIVNKVEGDGNIATAKGTRLLFRKLRYGLKRKMITLEWNKGETPIEIEKSSVTIGDKRLLIQEKSA